MKTQMPSSQRTSDSNKTYVTGSILILLGILFFDDQQLMRDGLRLLLEPKVLRLLAEGLSNREIAGRLYLPRVR
ncbi:MAG TPA: hypothetical protein EYP25_02035 [Anaerolineae bacterium]|nr:hypothetical protein [Anaerolineae bacterium]